MSFTKRAFYFFSNLKNPFENKSLQRYSIFILGFFLTLGFFLNSYAVGQEYQYDPVEVYEEMDKFSTASTDTEGKHSHKSQSFEMVDFAANMVDLVYPEVNANYDKILQASDISVMSKLGLLGMVDVPITAMLYDPPYIDIPEHLAQEWIPNYDQTGGIYASGYSMLSQTNIVTALWGTTRNIAYLFFVIVFIIAGFMIMFRHKLGGQTMVTVYNTLPNIIVGLILVTFSFAIAGLIIDIGALFIRIIAGELNITAPVDATQPLGVTGQYFGLIGAQLIKLFTANILKLILAGGAGLAVGAATGAWGFIVFGGIAGLLIVLILVAVIFYISIKIFFTLIKAYVGILFDTIAAPLVFAIATIPGRQSVMKDWFNRVLKNVLVFVLVFLLINLPIYLIQEGYGEQFTMFGGDLGAAGATASTGMEAIIMVGVAFYMLFLAASAPKMLEEFLPQLGGKGGKEAAAGVKADMGKIPLVGGFFGK